MVNDIYYFNLVPLALFIILLAVFSLDKTILLLAFLVPLSVPLREYYPDLGFDMYLPTEPILVGVLILATLKILYTRTVDKQILRHPISLAVFFSLLWIFITAVTSTMPLVSMKFLLSRLWFVVPFYFVGILVFKRVKMMRIYIALYLLALMGVIAYTIYNQMGYGLWNQKAANFVCSPFYNDHTAYGAALAMLVFPVIGFIFDRRLSLLWKFLSFVVLAILLGALVLSYSRAAWLSVAASLVIMIFMLLKIKFKWVMTMGISLILIGFFTYNTVINNLKKNKQDSSTNLEQQVQSMSNISTDASNVERFNRWNCAWRMFKKKPILGWGPGTYMFKYAPFQLSYEKTIISTNEGDRGNAHSEYLGPLAESGVMGMIYALLLLVTSIYTGLMAHKKAVDKETRKMIMFIFLGLITYFIHGFLNNFLDTDKLSALFWGYLAMLVSFDLYFTKKETSTQS